MIDIEQQTKEEWRELGFFYDYDEAQQVWLCIGSRNGLLNFSNRLNEYVSDSRNEKLGKHEHFLPYMYLTIVTWEEPQITDYGIYGSLLDLKRLANIIEEKVKNSDFGDTFQIDKEYSENNSVKLLFDLREDTFDPATVDSLL